MSRQIRVLVVDDSALMRKALKAMLVDGGFEVDTARNGVDCLDQVRHRPPDVITLDVNMPEMDGLTCLARLMAENPLPVVMVSSLTDAAAAVTFEALELGAVDYVAKPGGTVSLDIETVRRELVAKVTAAADAKIRRAGGLRERLRRQREEAEDQRTGSTTTPRSWAGPAAASADQGTSAAGARTSSGARTPSVSGERARAGQPASGTARRVPAPRAPRRLRGLMPELVLVGSSTGGPTALGTVFGDLPATFAPPIVVAQHIPASFTRHLASRLNDDCRLAVCEVSGVEVLRPGTIYVGRGDADVVIARRPDGLVAKSVPASAEYRWHPSVDRLVASALATCPDPRRLVGVLLTGMGDDGAAEMTRLRELGGRTIAESKQTAVVWGMPGDLVRRDGADCVLDLDDIGATLATWA